MNAVPNRHFTLLLTCLVGCQSTLEPCDTPGALSACSERSQSDEHYIAQSHAYFDTMDYEPFGDIEPSYGETVARWEWPPWLMLTAYGRDDILAADALLVLYPSVVKQRDCQAFDTQPFGRCYVTFYYDAHEGAACPVYEEFTFNESGEITWIEAWSDLPGFRHTEDLDDPWGEGADVHRLSTRIPGLGSSTGALDLNGPELTEAAQTDEEVADFVRRAQDWQAAWAEELADSETMWETGCGYTGR